MECPNSGNGEGGRLPGSAKESSVSEKDARRAEELKNVANDFFKGKELLLLLTISKILECDLHGYQFSLFIEKNFNEAIEHYSKAIELNPTVASYYGNRSFAYLKTESYGYALTDASKALELDYKYIKVSWRRNITSTLFEISPDNVPAIFKNLFLSTV